MNPWAVRDSRRVSLAVETGNGDQSLLSTFSLYEHILPSPTICVRCWCTNTARVLLSFTRLYWKKILTVMDVHILDFYRLEKGLALYVHPCRVD